MRSNLAHRQSFILQRESFDLILIYRLATVARRILSPFEGYFQWVLYGLEKKFH